MNACAQPDAPIVKCFVCGADVKTCERQVPENYDYRCPEHPHGAEIEPGIWVCSSACEEKYHQEFESLS